MMLTYAGSLTPFPVLGFLLTGFILWNVFRIIYNIFFSPLSQISGPKRAAATDFWLFWQQLGLRKCPTINSCFQKYGDIVRVGPNKIALNTEQAMKDIYGIGTKFTKSDWYPAMADMAEAKNVFTIQDSKEHADRRRIFAKLMSKTNVVVYKDDLNGHIRNFTRLLEKRTDSIVDMMPIYRYLALDFLGTTTFGRSFNLMKTGSDHPFLHDIDDLVVVNVLRAYTPSWLWKLVAKIPIKSWKFLLSAENRICGYSDEVINEQLVDAEKNGGELSEGQRKTAIGTLLHHRDAHGSSLPRNIITGEIGTLFFAGTDTTSNTLSFITFEIARQSSVQASLFRELKEHLPDPKAIPDIMEIEKWPYLTAVMKEGLRKYAAAPSHLERVVPPGGAVIENFFIPAGTIVGVQAYSIHRRPDIFPNPEEFLPERWLNETEEMRRHFMPYGLGSRVCLGQHIANMEMRLALMALVRNFELSLPSNYNPEDMACKDFWLIFPAGKKAEVFLKART